MSEEKPSDLFSVKGKVVLLTGGAGFLGRQYIRALTRCGATVFAWDNNQAKLDEAKQLFEGNDLVHFSNVDVTDEVAVREGVGKIVEQAGKIDVLLNNAALNPAVGSPEAEKQFSLYQEYPTDLYRKEVEANLVSQEICAKAVAPFMMRQKSGSIVNVASELALIAYDHRIYPPGRRKSPGYISTKAGILGLTRAWASHLGEYGVRVNSVSWGGMQHPNHPEDFVKKYSYLNMLGRMAQMDEYSGTIIFLCSDASSFMTGHNLVVDGGKSAW